MGNGDAGRYLLGDTPAEIRHLVEQALVYAEEANELFDRIGVAPGSSVVDVGCGVLGALHVLAERVGEAGRVVGIDREPRILDGARDLAKQRGLTVELVEADATATGIPEGTFDLAHCRTLLLNVGNPRAIVAEMVRITRPGGVVAVQEPDGASWNCDPPHPAFAILRDEIFGAYRRSGKDFNIGRQIGRFLRDAGLTDVQVRPTARATRPGDFYQTFVIAIASLVRDVIVAHGTLTADELDSYSAALREHLGQPGTITLQPVMWQAWGLVPQPA